MVHTMPLPSLEHPQLNELEHLQFQCTAAPAKNLISDVTTPDGTCANAYVRVRSEIIQREVFGPVVTVQRFRDEVQASVDSGGKPPGRSLCLAYGRTTGKSLLPA